MTDIRPAKPWSVDGPADHGDGERYRSQAAAYEAVAELTGFGHKATVYHWQDGSWRLYERVEVAPAATEATP